MVALNDEAWARLSTREAEGELVLGVPKDIVFPVIPDVLRRFARDFPRIKVDLVSSYTRTLKADFEAGAIDVILTTEDRGMPGAETLAVAPLAWVGARGGVAWRARPLRLAFSDSCIFRQPVQRSLDRAGIPWEMAVSTSSDASVDAVVSADLAVHVVVGGAFVDKAEQGLFERVEHEGALPPLWSVHVNMYAREAARAPAQADLAELLRRAYAATQPGPQPRAVEAA
jgi:DNA-binding transcriptional LysR family regulator